MVGDLELFQEKPQKLEALQTVAPDFEMAASSLNGVLGLIGMVWTSLVGVCLTS
jgi:hypothetical protein